ncbi:hypothetical protein LINGRAHAP2_LOCUS9499 [Linum grandiflorum]
MGSRWIRPEIYPLLVPMAFVLTLMGFQLSRNVIQNPDVRVNKSNRKAGVLENYDEGEKYAEHGLRKFLRTRPPQVMPALNSFFSSIDK